MDPKSYMDSEYYCLFISSYMILNSKIQDTKNDGGNDTEYRICEDVGTSFYSMLFCPLSERYGGKSHISRN